MLSASISIAMNNTAFALMVAIPFLLIHAFLQARTSEIVDGLEAAKISFLNLVQRLKAEATPRALMPTPHRSESEIAMRVRRLRKEAAALEVTAFINLIVVLVPFLLSTAVFTRLAVMDLTLPAQSNNGRRAAEGQRPEARDRDPPRRARGRRPHRRADPAHRARTTARPRRQGADRADAAGEAEVSRDQDRTRAGRARHLVRRAGAGDGRGARRPQRQRRHQGRARGAVPRHLDR